MNFAPRCGNHAIWISLFCLVASAGIPACKTDHKQSDEDPDGQTTPEVTPIPVPEDPLEYELLPIAQRLLRASMVLRGTRPSSEEYEMVLANEDNFGSLVDAYLNSEEFGATVRQLFTEWMELDQAPDTYPAGFPALGPLAGLGTHELNSSIIQAAGRLAEDIVMDDRPWTQIVTADYTMADETVATVWGLPYDGDGGWIKTNYEDGRPLAGVLSDGWLFTRMPSTENNRHRERASLIANSLICHDYPGRPVEIPPDIDLTSPAAIENAIENNEVCVGCHHTLDPLASFFSVHYALRIPEYESSYPLVQYTPEAANDFGRPAWYGQPADNLEDLGQLIADDPRFAACAVRRFYSEMMHLPLAEVPEDAVLRYLSVFRRADLEVKPLLRAIVNSDEFGARALAEGGDQNDAARVAGLRRATPQQLDSMFAELTGYRWTTYVSFPGYPEVGQVPLMRDYLWGYRTMAGGPNNFDTTEHIRTADPSTLLVLGNLAERAAREVVRHDFDNTQSPFLIDDADARKGENAAVRSQLSRLHLRLFGEVSDENNEDLERSTQLFASAKAITDDDARAWSLTLAALLQDPRMLYY